MSATRLEKHRRLVRSGKLWVDISKELNELSSEKGYCPVCGQEISHAHKPKS